MVPTGKFVVPLTSSCVDPIIFNAASVLKSLMGSIWIQYLSPEGWEVPVGDSGVVFTAPVHPAANAMTKSRRMQTQK
jgi:hypothetical protein